MALAKDEVLGLVVAAVIGGSALGLYGYRQTRGAPEAEVEDTTAADNPATQSARDGFAEALEIAFVDDGTDASVAADETTLEITWFPCSKPMLDRLLKKKKDALTRKVREASGLSLQRLRLLGFTEVVCDNTRGTRVIEPLGVAAKPRPK
ncbi:MAG: hypothetical protein H0T89_06185 [Deltaproteobacteria bacterium]|nr:hypothetical protein [Deltaproteobacteria bacterium]MDQ3298620.1 hypothetical protein [Myxococcota bacterium]